MSAATFSSLDSRLPLALLPVRLEARYMPRRRPSHLLVRVFPDVIHADAHQAWLSEREADAGRTYWTSIWGTTDEVVVSEARRWLAAQTTPYRALWVASATRPTNLDASLDPGVPGPEFGDVVVEDRSAPVRAALLPDGWMVRLYDRDLQLVHTAYSAPVADGLAMAPTLSPAGAEAVHPVTGAPLVAPLGFLTGQDLLWTVDFDQAEAVGMGIRIPIALVPNPVGVLLVLGVRSGRAAVEENDRLEALLAAHWYGRGLDAVPQGTPTNNTDAGRSGLSLQAPDVDELFAREESERPLAPGGRALLLAADPALLYRLPAADVASLALGRVRANTLDKISHADRAEGAAAWAMNVAIGHATLGRYLSGPFARVDGSVATGDDATTFQQWYVDWVRGGSTLPVLRCGEQPYGLLPITHRPVENLSWPAPFEIAYEHRLAQFLPTWRSALPVAALDPEATDSTPSGTEIGDATMVAEVLGGVPHPTTLQLRRATDHLPADTAALYEIMDRLQLHADGDRQLDVDRESLIDDFWENRKQWIFGLPHESPPVPPPGIVAQLVHVDLFRQEVAHADDVTTRVTTARTVLPILDDELRPLLELYQEANDAAPSVLWDWTGGAGLGAPDMVRLTGTTFADTVTPVSDLIAAHGDVAEIRDVIAGAIELLDAVEAGNVPPPQRDRLVTSPAPLLAHLLDVTCRTVPASEVGPVRVALAVLAAMIDSPAVADPLGELERLLRETLGLAMYRIDAWVTAVAASRLATKRRARPAGLQIGGYGWLLDLSQTDDRVTQGFIHAPSLPHAATAAVLRSGWSAYGTASGDTPLSVDLSSDRIRGAQWVLDGVRNGQDLAEMLGARFERSLHDAFLDEWIETVRLAALEARGETRPPTAVVDGLLVARAFSDVEPTGHEAALRADLAVETAPVLGDPEGNARRAAVRWCLRRAAADLDAVADLTMAQAVHALLQDNSEAAAAALVVTGGGDGSVPRIDVTATQREAQLVSHRVVTIWPARAAAPRPAPGREPASPVEVAEPRLVPWLERLLPPLDRVVAAVTERDEDGTVVSSDAVSLAELGVTAPELALLAAAAPTQSTSRLGRCIVAAASARARARRRIDVDLGATSVVSDGTVSVDEFGVIAGAMLDAIGRSRPLRAGDLVLPSIDTTGAGPDAGELGSRVVLVERALVDLIDDLAGGEEMVRARALVRAASLGVRSAVRALEATAGDGEAGGEAGGRPVEGPAGGSADELVGVVIAALKQRLEPDEEAPDEEEPGTEPGEDEPGKPGGPGEDDPGEDDPGKDEPGKDEPGKDEPGKDEPGKDEPGKPGGPGEDEPGKPGRRDVDAEPPTDPAGAALARLRRLVGGVIPILPLFTPVPDPDRVASAGSALRRRQAADEGHTWLRQAGRVRTDLGAMVDWLLLAESASAPAAGPYGLAQVPHSAGPWAAVGRPAGDGDRLSILSLTGPQSLLAEAEPVAGLLVDSWTEGIPVPRQQTGVAVHFDAPTARPPQAILLSVVEDDRGFSADELADQLLHTIELAKLRVVGPAHLGSVGHYLPAVFLPDDAVVSGGDA